MNLHFLHRGTFVIRLLYIVVDMHSREEHYLIGGDDVVCFAAADLSGRQVN